MTADLHDSRTGDGRTGDRGLVGLALSLVVAAGCTSDANPTFFIDAIQAPSVAMGQCRIPTGSSMEFLSQGILDLAVRSDLGYVLYPRVVNDLAMTAMPPQIEQNRIQVKGIDVKLIPPAGITLPASETCRAEFHVSSPVSVMPMMGSATLAAEVVQPCHVAGLRASIGSRLAPGASVPLTVAMRARGAHGGTDILSAEVLFTVRLCVGCLQTGFSGAYADFNYPRPIPRCDQLEDNPYGGNACNPAQDFGPVLCCALDATGMNIECPGQPRAPSMR